MNLEMIRKEVENLIDDESFDPDTIYSYITNCVQSVCAMVRIPSLKRLGTVTLSASGYSVDISDIGGSSFGGILTKAVNSSGAEYKIYRDLEHLMDDYPTMGESGNACGVALEGKTLYYNPIPDADETATIVFYKVPSLITKQEDIPSDIPEYLHRKLLVHGSAWIIYDQIEDGIDGPKLNTINHHFHSFSEDNKESGIVKLREYLAQRKIHHITSRWNN